MTHKPSKKAWSSQQPPYITFHTKKPQWRGSATSHITWQDHVGCCYTLQTHTHLCWASGFAHLAAPPPISKPPSPLLLCLPPDIFPFAPLLPLLSIGVYKSAWQGTPLLVTPLTSSSSSFPCSFLCQGKMMPLYTEEVSNAAQPFSTTYFTLGIKEWAKRAVCNYFTCIGRVNHTLIFGTHTANKSIWISKEKGGPARNRFGTKLIMSTSERRREVKGESIGNWGTCTRQFTCTYSATVCWQPGWVYRHQMWGGLSLQTCPGARQHLTKHNEQLGRKREMNQKRGCKCITKCCKTAAVIKIYSHFTSPMTTVLLPCLHYTEKAIKKAEATSVKNRETVRHGEW